MRSEAAAAAWAAPTRASLPCFLLPQAPPPCRLYALYLIDSIAKNVGGPYPPLLGAGLASAFAAAAASRTICRIDSSKPRLVMASTTWSGSTVDFLAASEASRAFLIRFFWFWI